MFSYGREDIICRLSSEILLLPQAEYEGIMHDRIRVE
jgi:hypothetical protein